MTHQKIVSCICKAFARLCGKDGLRKKAFLLPKADFEINTAPVQCDVVANMPYKPRRIMWRTLVSATIIIVLTFSVCMGVSAQFRNMVISFFKSSNTEIIPPNISPSGNKSIVLIGKQSVESIADVWYFEMPDISSVRSNIVAVHKEDGTSEYYKIEGEKARKLDFEFTPILTIIEFRGWPFALKCNIGKLDGEPYIEQLALNPNDPDEMSNDYIAYPERHYDDECIWVTLRMRGSGAYFVKYNFKTGEVTDIIAEHLKKDVEFGDLQFDSDLDKHRFSHDIVT